MLSLLNRNRQAVGLDIGSSALKAAELRSLRGGGYELVSLGFEELSPDCIVDGVIISKLPVSDAINNIFTNQRIKTGRINTSISGHSVIVKKISLPPERGGPCRVDQVGSGTVHPLRYRRRQSRLPGTGRESGNGQPGHPPRRRQKRQDHRLYKRHKDGG